MSGIKYIQTGKVATPLPKSESPLINALRALNDALFLSDQTETDTDANHRRARKELRAAGFSMFQLNRHESWHIASLLNKDEHIRAAIRGHIYELGGVLLIATGSRILYLQNIPNLQSSEQLSYDDVLDVSVNKAGYLSTVTVFTKTKTYQLDYVESRQAETFLEYVESQIYYPSLQSAVEFSREVLMK